MSPQKIEIPKLGIGIIKVFTTTECAHDSENPTVDVESSQAYVEVKNGNAVLKQQLNTSKANQQRQQEHADIWELVHEHY